MYLTTASGGHSWIVKPQPAGVGQIQCPRPGACVAIGVSDQGSTSTPIYTNHG